MKLIALAASVAVIGFAAGCGGGSAGETPVAASFADCMKQQGVELPTARPSGMPTVRPSGIPTVRPSGMPTVRPSGFSGGFPGGGGLNQRPSNVDDATWQKALEACGSLRPSGRPGGGEGNEMSAYLNCLSERGITFSPGQVLPSEAAVCEVLRP